jgi:hypothetical protein
VTRTPKGVQGAFRYTIRILRSTKPLVPGSIPDFAGKPFTLRVVVREADSTVLHFHIIE